MTGLLHELPPRHRQGLLAGLDLSLRDRPVAEILRHPERSAHVRQEHLDAIRPRGARAGCRRSFQEETGHAVGDVALVDLGQIRQKSGKTVFAWGAKGDLDTAVSNTYDMEWPPRSGGIQSFPMDRVKCVDLGEARRKLKAAQVHFPDRLEPTIAPD